MPTACGPSLAGRRPQPTLASIPRSSLIKVQRYLRLFFREIGFLIPTSGDDERDQSPLGLDAELVHDDESDGPGGVHRPADKEPVNTAHDFP